MKNHQGSPPRVRGKVHLIKFLNFGIGITPACAGKSDTVKGTRVGYWITPACAGKRATETEKQMLKSDHPRVCGEKLNSFGEMCQERGSPPRVRGKVFWLQSSSDILWITPACAGKSTIFIDNAVKRRDHPRVCGEKINSHLFNVNYLGSPPRVRGKAVVSSPERSSAGITPACAGKSNVAVILLIVFRDHPRVCGEKECYSQTHSKNIGSPPRVRGKGCDFSFMFC